MNYRAYDYCRFAAIGALRAQVITLTARLNAIAPYVLNDQLKLEGRLLGTQIDAIKEELAKLEDQE